MICPSQAMQRAMSASLALGGPINADIARRIAWLTREQTWPATSPPGIFVATGTPPREALLSSLAHYGLDEVQRL